MRSSTTLIGRAEGEGAGDGLGGAVAIGVAPATWGDGEVGAADAAEAVTRGRHRKHAASRFAIRSRGRTVTSMSFVAVIIESSGDTLSESSICWVYSTGIA